MPKTSEMNNRWIKLHNEQYDLRARNQESPNPLTEAALSELYKDKLRLYFNKYPDQLTDHYSELLNSDPIIRKI